MVDKLNLAIAWLLSGVTFWIVVVALISCVTVSVRGRSYWWSAAWVGAIAFCVIYAVPSVSTYIMAHPLMSVGWVVVYFAVGVAVSLGKWVYVVKDAKQLLQQHRNDYDTYTDTMNKYKSIVSGSRIEQFTTSQDRYNQAKTIDDAKDRLEQMEEHEDFMEYFQTLNSYKFTVRQINGVDTIVVNTKRQPIAEWIMFWPITLLTFVFEPIWSALDALVSKLGSLYDTISAKMLSSL